MSQSTRVELEPAYVLHGRGYRETSQILELFTQSHGRVGVVARGSRRPKSALRGLLNPFQPLRASWAGRGELATLTQAELAGVALPLGSEVVMAGFYVNELLLKLVGRNDPYPDLFAHYVTLVAALAQGADELESLLRRFELQLLHEIGYAPDLLCDAIERAPLDPDALYEFSAEEGALPAGTSGGGRSQYRGEVLLAIGRLDFTAVETQRAAKQLLRNVLNFHLGDRGLQTRRVASAMKR